MDKPPYYVDLATMAACLSLDEATALEWVADGILPRPIKRNGQDQWIWRAVDRAMTGDDTRSVYFVEANGFIKIGFTADMERRMCALASSSPHPTTLLHRMPGTRDHEIDLHRQFAHLRVRGEWFRSDPELLEFIEGLRAAGGQAQPIEKKQ
jgi:hypothetical protein